jgi:hypothetical protein
MSAFGREPPTFSASDASSGNGSLEPLGALFRRYDLLASSSTSSLPSDAVRVGSDLPSSGKSQAKFKNESSEADKVYDADVHLDSSVRRANAVVGRSGSRSPDSSSQSLQFYSPRDGTNESLKDQQCDGFSPGIGDGALCACHVIFG